MIKVNKKKKTIKNGEYRERKKEVKKTRTFTNVNNLNER
jgi:hypothetical protein